MKATSLFPSQTSISLNLLQLQVQVKQAGFGL